MFAATLVSSSGCDEDTEEAGFQFTLKELDGVLDVGGIGKGRIKVDTTLPFAFLGFPSRTDRRSLLATLKLKHGYTNSRCQVAKIKFC